MPTFRRAIPVLPASDIGRSMTFYAERLGMRVGYQNEGYAVLIRDDIQIHLWAATDESWKERGGLPPIVSGAENFIAGTASYRIFVGDIDALYAEMKEKRIVHPNGHLETKPYGLREFTVLDPDKNAIAFFAEAESGELPD